MKDLFKNVKADLPAGLVVFLVALPLCLGIALASGAPLFSGVISGIIGGVVVGFLSDSKLSVSGPAAGLTVIVFSAIATLGSFEVFLVAVVLSGILQLVLGYVKAGIIGHFFPSSVITGMLTAIGLSIIMKQIPHAFGYDLNDIDLSAFGDKYGRNSISEIFYMFKFILPGAAIISIVSMGILLLWDRPFVKQNKVLNLIPGPLLVVAFGILANQLFIAVAPALAIESSHLVALPKLDGFSSFVNELRFPDFAAALTNPQVYVVAITIAIVGSLESLLSLDAADKLDPEKRIASPNQELKAQGWGNIISGLIGGIPVTAVIVRSSANVNAGAKGKLSAISHGLFLFISVLFLAPFLNLIPLAALAAVLIHVGLKLNKVSIYKKAFKGGADQYIPFLVTIVTILFTDLLKGITVGILVGFVFVLKTNFRSAVTVSNKDNNYHLEFIRSMYFFNKAQLRKILHDIPDGATVTIDSAKIEFIDNDIKQTVDDFCSTAHQRSIRVDVNLPGSKFHENKTAA